MCGDDEYFLNRVEAKYKHRDKCIVIANFNKIINSQSGVYFNHGTIWAYYWRDLVKIDFIYKGNGC